LEDGAMKKELATAAFLLLLAMMVSPVIGDEPNHHNDQTVTLNGYNLRLLIEPETPKAGEEVHLVVHVELETNEVSGLHVEVKITKMEMHGEEMEEHSILSFEEGHAHEEEEPGHYALHHTFEEEGEYMIRVKIEDVGISDPFHIEVRSGFDKSGFTLPLVFIAVAIGASALVGVWTKTRSA